MLEAHQLNNHDSECVVSICDLSKKYCRNLRRSLRYGLKDIANEVLQRKPRGTASLREGEFWALENVSFEVGRGESLAIIGANGSGKSTLLKVLYGLVKPDGGYARLRGRVGALIELGTGFNPLLSGRENIHVNAAVFGFTRKQTEPLMESIIDFAGIDDFIDTPLQYYSSGMRTRLAYAVAAHLQPDVLLVDEVLAVGDIAFQRKCVVHMQKYLEKGGSLLFVSHSPYHVQAICQRGILLEQGKLTYSGSAVETLDRYFQIQHQKSSTSQATRTAPVLDADHPVIIENVTFEPASGEEIWTGEEVRFTIQYQALESQMVYWGFGIWTSDGWICVTGNYTPESWKLEAGQGEFSCVIPSLPLVGGSYLLKAVIIEASTNQPLALFGWKDAPLTFSVRTPADTLSNNLKALNQLVTLEVEWL